MRISYVKNVINGGHIRFLLSKCNFLLIKSFVFSDNKNTILDLEKVISNMVESKDNAENKIYHVISAAILKNANLGIFPKKFFGKNVFPINYMS